MSDSKPTVVLVHGAFAESASWNGVIDRLRAERVPAIAVANPLRSLPGDAAYLKDVLASVRTPVVLAGHSYGGMVITEAAAGRDQVAGLPETFLIVDENDVLRDEGEAYGRKLTEAGVRTTTVRYDGTLHDFMMLNPVRGTAASAAAIAQAIHVLRQALHRS